MSESQIIILKEYQSSATSLTINVEDFKNYKSNFEKVFDIFNKTIHEEKVNFYIKAKFWLGILTVSKYSIIVQPKIESAKFIHMLLSIDPDLAEFLGDFTDSLGLDEGFFQVFVKKFIDETLDLLYFWRRKGYTLIEETGKKVRGKIHLSDTIKANLRGDIKITYQFHDFTSDIFINQILKYTILYLEPIIFQMFKEEGIEILSLLSNVSLLPNLEPYQIDRIKYDRFTLRYKKIHQICKMILLNNLISLSEGDFHFHCFYFNAWDIYEKHLRKIISDRLKTSYFITKSYWYGNEENSWDNNKTQPDITILHEDNPILLLDAKYKIKHSQNDENQAGNYIRELLINKSGIDRRFRNCILIYPKSPETDFHFNTKDTGEYPEGGRVYRHSIDLSQVDDMNYLDNWVEEIEERFLKQIYY